MTFIDCFNGDADGICALTQLRRATPTEKQVLITGVKRDIQLLSRVSPAMGDVVTVLDISLDKNRSDLERVLETGADVFYSDHHFAGEIPKSKRLTTLINTAPDVCTSLLINSKLKGKYLDWGMVGTFGDNLRRSALELAKQGSFTEGQIHSLENLGIYLNYNGYGASLEDLYFDPAELYQRTVKFDSALSFLSEDKETYSTLEEGYHSDMNKANSVLSTHVCAAGSIFQLPNERWSRRVSGVFGNALANKNPEHAHAVLTEKDNGNFLVSVRAPLSRKVGADELCRQFPSGGGRAAAAGINDLHVDDLSRFISKFEEQFA